MQRGSSYDRQDFDRAKDIHILIAEPMNMLSYKAKENQNKGYRRR